ncbi:hypothetical protein H9X96_22225 [Pedobacter sp. N36a]|uniref:hypothetical protein n=1 Tax=Pedobacter sp. N36a TaxID=2767996 RepID=UPI0016570AD3|nr:hypothetical protein [Pedobacter sp. N36a]MBC8988475.1 hypothetical protein [Pedobacter sp. N36a]
MKIKLSFFVCLILALCSCKKEVKDTYNIKLNERLDGFYKIINATSTLEYDLNDDGNLTNNMLIEIPDLKTSTLDVLVSKTGKSFHLLWPEQYLHNSDYSFDMQGRIYNFNYEDTSKQIIPLVYDKSKSTIFSPPVKMHLIKDGLIECTLIREIITSKGKYKITIDAIYQIETNSKRRI